MDIHITKQWSPRDLTALYNNQEDLSALDTYALQSRGWAKARINNYKDKELQKEPYTGSVIFQDGKYYVELDGKVVLVPFNYEALIPILEKDIKELNEDVVKFTDKQGGETVQAFNNLSDPEYMKIRDAVKSSGGKVTDMKTGRFLEEAENSVSNADIVNLGKQLQKLVENTLKEHGDDISFTKATLEKATGYIVIHVHYQQNPDNPEVASEDRFVFDVTEGKVRLVDEGTKIDLCPLTQQSGTLTINVDLAKDALLNFIKGESNVDIMEENKNCLEEFASAVEAYKANKTKDTTKNLFRVARSFEGDTIQQKMKNAIKAWKNNSLPVQEQEDIETTQVEKPEACTCNKENNAGDVCMNLSLFIRLLEYAKEEAKEDIDLHWLAQNVQNFSAERGCLDMGDYMQLIAQSAFKPEDPEKDNPEPEKQNVEENLDNSDRRFDVLREYLAQLKDIVRNITGTRLAEYVKGAKWVEELEDAIADMGIDLYDEDRDFPVGAVRDDMSLEEMEGQKWESETEPWDSADRFWKQIALSKVTGNIRRDFTEERCDRMFATMSPDEQKVILDYLRNARTGRPENFRKDDIQENASFDEMEWGRLEPQEKAELLDCFVDDVDAAVAEWYGYPGSKNLSYDDKNDAYDEIFDNLPEEDQQAIIGKIKRNSGRIEDILAEKVEGIANENDPVYHNLVKQLSDKCTPEMHARIMQYLSDKYDLAESLDDTVEQYIMHSDITWKQGYDGIWDYFTRTSK